MELTLAGSLRKNLSSQANLTEARSLEIEGNSSNSFIDCQQPHQTASAFTNCQTDI